MTKADQAAMWEVVEGGQGSIRVKTDERNGTLVWALDLFIPPFRLFGCSSTSSELLRRIKNE